MSTPDVSQIRSLIIIGSGPAGYTAAVYAGRAELNPLVFEGSVEAGGALMNTTDVENYPGFPDGIMGPEMMDSFRKQAERFGAELIPDDVQRVELTGDVKRVWDSAGTEHRAHAVVLAMGSGYRKLGVPGETEFSGRGTSWCATCDGFFFRGQDIAVIGGGDSAMEEATFLTRFANSVTVVHRRDELRASKIMQDRAFTNEKITFCWDTEVLEVLGDEKVTGLKVRNNRTDEVETLNVTGVFEAIGHDPRSELVRGQVELDEDGYVQVQAPTTWTGVPGVFAAGDLVDSRYRQAVTAAGTGCAAALDAERFLAELEHRQTGSVPASGVQAATANAAG